MEILMGKSSINEPFSMAMLNNQRVEKKSKYASLPDLFCDGEFTKKIDGKGYIWDMAFNSDNLTYHRLNLHCPMWAQIYHQSNCPPVIQTVCYWTWPIEIVDLPKKTKWGLSSSLCEMIRGCLLVLWKIYVSSTRSGRLFMTLVVNTAPFPKNTLW